MLVGLVILAIIGFAIYGGWKLWNEKHGSDCREYAERICYSITQFTAEPFQQCVARNRKDHDDEAWCRQALKDLDREDRQKK